MGAVIALIGLILLLLGYFTLGIILLIVGLVLIFIPGVPYGYSSYRGRRPPP